jgi:hypothetical protein
MIKQWSQTEIQQYIDSGVEESLTLEYKAADSLGKSDGKKKEITKDVSAMANSAGGTIIYGVKEFGDDGKKHLPEKLDAINRTEFTKEWLEQVINNIRPHIDGIVIYPVNIDTASNHVAYVVEIPKSDTAHQATNHRYYRRYNFQSVPMEDYEIRDVMARRQHPKLDLTFEVEIATKYERDMGDLYMRRSTARTVCNLKVKAKNVGGVYAQFVNCFIQVPGSLLSESTVESLELRGKQVPESYRFYEDNTVRDVVDVKFIGAGMVNKYGPSRFDPILPGLSHNWEFPISSKFLEIDLTNLRIKWAVHADNAPRIKGEVVVKDIEAFDIREKE